MLEFNDGMKMREITDQIVIHHLGIVDEDGNVYDRDMSADDIHVGHLERGWCGIGYHYVVRKNGEIEDGRPEEYAGAHVEGENYHTLGIVVSGTFMNEYMPTDKQIESVSILCAKLCKKYGINYNIVGHRDLMATDCPGDNLYNLLDTIKNKAVWYVEQGEV